MIRSLNLDGTFLPLTYPEIEYDLIKFPGGELHIKLNPKINYSKVEKVIITQRVNNSDNLMSILLAADALRRIGVKHLDLIMPYIPYARQDRYDRVENLGESLSIEVFANLINALGFEQVTVLDAHSEISPVLIKNAVNLNSLYYVDQALIDSRRITIENEQQVITYITTEPLWLISPDSGANKKSNKLYSQLINQLGINFIAGLVKCDKIRNIGTGKLSGFEVFADDLQGLDCFITDDICDGGGTFNGLAKVLKEHNAGSLFLYVTHGIFSKGYDELLSNFTKIYTTNSIKDISHERIKQFNIQL